MGKAARAIVIENDKILVMHRNKYGSEYYTLVGGRANAEDSSLEETLKREVKEETGLEVTSAQLVFIEEHREPYNQQYIYLCRVAPHESIAIADTSEEAALNKLDANIHTPYWATLNSFSKLAFRTPQLQQAIVDSIKKGFPKEPLKL